MTLRTLNYGNYGIFLIMVMQDFVHQPYTLNPKPLGNSHTIKKQSPEELQPHSVLGEARAHKELERLLLGAW